MTETTHADGTVDVVSSARYNDIGLAIHRRRHAGQSDRRSQLLAAARGRRRQCRRDAGAARLREADAPPGGHLGIDFSASDLDDVRALALERLADEVAMNGERPINDEIAESLADGDGVVEFDGVEYDFGAPYTDLEAEQTPEDVSSPSTTSASATGARRQTSSPTSCSIAARAAGRRARVLVRLARGAAERTIASWHDSSAWTRPGTRRSPSGRRTTPGRRGGRRGLPRAARRRLLRRREHGEGQAEQVRELPADAELVILRRPIAGG